MKVLLLGGTRFAGVHTVRALLARGHAVTIATRGRTPDPFGDSVRRIRVDRQSAGGLAAALGGAWYDAVIDNLAFCSNDVRALLDSVRTARYVMTSTVSVYRALHMGMREEEMDTTRHPLEWCGQDAHPYDEVKRQAEAALFQVYGGLSSVAVRFPWIFGPDDYTGRLFFYPDHVLRGLPMHVDNLDARLSFIHSAEAGRFLAWCAESSLSGAVNAAGRGTISPREILTHVERRAGRPALLCADGAAAPLCGAPSFCLDTSKAEAAGAWFRAVEEWAYPTLDGWVDDWQARGEDTAGA